MKFRNAIIAVCAGSFLAAAGLPAMAGDFAYNLGVQTMQTKKNTKQVNGDGRALKKHGKTTAKKKHGKTTANKPYSGR